MTTFDGGAIQVRMSTQGVFDVRKGGAYAFDSSVPYSAGLKYKIHIAVNMTAKTYTVHVTSPDGKTTLLAKDYAFRSSQAAASLIGNLGIISMTGQFTLHSADFTTTPTPAPAPAPAPTPAPPNPIPTSPALQPNDPRTTVWIDPNITWAKQKTPMTLQISDYWNASIMLQQTPESGDPSYTFARVTDPLNSAKKVIFHQLDNSYPKWKNTGRSSYSGGKFYDGQTYWIAFAFRLGADNYTNSGNSQGLIDLHHVNWGSDGDKAPRTPWGIMGHNSGSWSVILFGSYVQNYRIGTSDVTSYTYTVPAQPANLRNEWIYVVTKLRVGRNWSHNPMVATWMAVGNGSISKLFEKSDIPLGYIDMPADSTYIKPGLYQWDTTITRRTMWSKGIQVFREGSGTVPLNENTIIQMMRGL